MCVALAALDGVVRVKSSRGERRIPLIDFHRLPGNTPERDTALESDELITAVELPALPFAKRSLYRKVRDRASYAFALVSVAAAVEIEDGVIRQVRLALGGVAHKPWRASLAEEFLVGKPCDEQTLSQAASLELEAAQTYKHNAFKVELARRTIVSVFSELADGEAAR